MTTAAELSANVVPALRTGHRSAECGSVLVVARGDRRESLNLRVSPDLKRQIEAYAQRVGISINAAACILLTEQLREENTR